MYTARLRRYNLHVHEYREAVSISEELYRTLSIL
jgi:hypothetical protein